MADYRSFLLELNKNLQILQERQAKYGSNVPLDLLNQIDDHQAAIKLTEQAIAGELTEAEWQEALEPLLLAVRNGQVVKIEADTYVAGDLINGDKVAGDKVGRHKIEAGTYIEQATIITAPSPVEKPTDAAPAPGQPPFKGLDYFDVDDANLFFGREQLTAHLVGHLREHRFLAVVGASGSGKSSVVRAGLVPALQKGETLADGTQPCAGSGRWPIHIITPTVHPLKELAASLTCDAESVRATSVLMDDLAQDPRSLDLAVHRLISHTSAQGFLLVVDQFEELFTLCRDEALRRAFVDNLLAAAQEPDGPTRVVVTLRADFYHHCLHFDQLHETLETRQKIIGPMTSVELRQAIERPAEENGWKFAPGLVDLLLRDVGDEPGALPLLSHALLETWKRRRGRTLTLEGYAAAGGVHGAIAQTAQNVFQQLSADQQTIARNIFIRLTELGEGTQDTRRRAALMELLPEPEAKPTVEAVLKTLADARLVTTRQDSVEVAHEALIREWPLLRQWLDENRDALRIHRRLTEAATEWDQTERDASYLYRGVRLAEPKEWTAQAGAVLNELERAFLEAGLAEQAREGAEKEQQRQRELAQQRALAEEQRKRAEEAEARRQAETQRAQEAEAREKDHAEAATKLRRRAIWVAVAGVAALILAVAAIVFGIQATQNAQEIARQNEKVQAELNFYQTTDPVERLTELHKLFSRPDPDSQARARQLFFAVSDVDQVALLRVEDDKLVEVGQKLLPNLADINRTGYTDQHLQALLESLPASGEADGLKSELKQWLECREAARSGEDEEALAHYDELVKLDSDNPALWYEQAGVQARLGYSQAALANLDKVMELAQNPGFAVSGVLPVGPEFASRNQMEKAVQRLLMVYPELGEQFKEAEANNLHLAAIELPTVKIDAKGVHLVRVPAGRFKMGSNTTGDEQPVHEVYLAVYYIDQYEVTNAQYHRCEEAGECETPACLDRYEAPDKADHPVVCVNWFQAKVYCEWRGGRLPTEAEWEKAARGTDERTYPWGEQINCDLANYWNCKDNTALVGTYPAGVSPYGAYDMGGNAWEWVQSEYKNYPYQADDGRENLGSTNVRVLRGGSWISDDSNARASNRDIDVPGIQDASLGFRCVAAPQ